MKWYLLAAEQGLPQAQCNLCSNGFRFEYKKFKLEL